MDCVSCGAELRSNARFCNRCGAVQPTEQPTPSMSATSAVEPMENGDGAHLSVNQASQAGTLEEGDGSARMKRPPRVLRAQDQQDQEGGVASLASEEDTQPSPAIRLSRLPVEGTTRPVAWADPENVETEILPVPVATTGKLERFDAVEVAHPAHINVPSEVNTPSDQMSAASVPVSEEGLAQTGVLAPDALSWPLPVSIIIGGRYRVEALVSAVPDDQDGENIYRVSDLKGYERCWSCLQEYGEGTEASDRFCRECGADMLAREYLMYERRIPAEGTEIAIDQANTAPEHPVVTGDLVTQEERAFTQSSRSYRVIPRVTEPSPFPHGAHILIGVATDVGMTRTGERNEDSVGALVLNLVHDSHKQPLALGIVADGLGGHVNGQDASRLATRMVTEYILRKVALPLVSLPVDGVAIEDDLKSVLLEGVLAANAALCNANDETGADMGSTLVAALLFGSSAYIVNVGDSRSYVFFDGDLHQITTDHSFVEQLIISGFVAPEDRYTHPQRNQILRSLGDELDIEIDFFEQKLKPGMRLMLCSDGLWEMVRDDESARILSEAASPQEACDRLIESANEHGGEDNISVVVIEVQD